MSVRRPLLTVAFLLMSASLLDADIVRLRNGDRITGRVLGPTTRRVQLQTPYGVLVLPRDSVARIEREDGQVEIVGTLEAAAPSLSPQEPARLQLAISGDTFWHAWDPEFAPADPSLRLVLQLDDAPLASYTDSTLDPEDLPNTVVNSFVFSREQLLMRTSPGVVAESPILAGDEIGLALYVPPEASGTHTLRIAYQLNEGTAAEPMWQDVVTASVDLVVNPGQTLQLYMRQSRGRMSYGRRKMENVATFVARLER